MPDSKPAATNFHEQIAQNQKKASWHQTVIVCVAILIIGLAVSVYGFPDLKGDAYQIIIGAFVLIIIYMVLIQKRKQDINAEILLAIFEQTWKSGRLGHHSWDELDFSLPSVLIEQLADDFHLISCNNQYGGTKTLGIKGNDARSLRVVQIYDGDAPTARMMLEKSKVVMTALERGHEIKKIEAMMDKLGA